MKLIFAGTPLFAQVALAGLIKQGHEVVAVMTQPDRPAGRGLKLQASAVKQLALQQQIPILQPTSLKLDGKNAEQAQQAKQQLTDIIQQQQVQALVVAAYGLMIPTWLLELMQSSDTKLVPRYGCLNIHASILPRWRGAAPIQRAIEAGDSKTGITIMQMNQGLDTGDILLQQECAIAVTDTSATLHDKLANLGANLIQQALTKPDSLTATQQPTTGISYAHKIATAEAIIDWQQTSQQIYQKINAFNPFPVCRTQYQQQLIKIWQAQPITSSHTSGSTPGSIIAINPNQLIVSCGVQGTELIALTKLQKSGGKVLTTAEFLRGFNLEINSCFN